SEILSHMKSMRDKLNKEHFENFRRFYFRNEEKDIAGASGLYSGAIPIIDMLLYGDQMSEARLSEFDRDEGLYPIHQQQLLAQARQLVSEHGSVMNKYNENPSREIRLALRNLISEILKFRRIHTGAVARHLSEVVTGEAEGSTGIKDVMKLLIAR